MAILELSQPLNHAATTTTKVDALTSDHSDNHNAESQVTAALPLAPETSPPVQVAISDVDALQEKAAHLAIEEKVETPRVLFTYSEKEVSQHRTLTDLWIIVAGDVYDMSEFQKTHPGGFKVLAGVAGKDATKKFDKYHRRAILAQEKHKKLIIGKVGAASQVQGAPLAMVKSEEKKKGLGRWFK